MIHWIWKILIGGCDHVWHVRQSGPLTQDGHTVGTYYDLQCETCGNVKRRNLTS